MEASTITATPGLARQRGRISAGPLLRLRSDEQLVRLFRSGSDEAFDVIHDRYRARLFAYARQMLAGSRQDAEDVLQDVFVRVYGALRANDREVSLRAWLYRIAHNRCIDELRRPAPPPPETFELIQPPAIDPISTLEQRESLRRLVADVQRLPEQQRSALLMREISGMAYQDLAAVLDVTIPAVKSLLVRARIGLAQAAEARDTACTAIRADLADAHERGVRASGLARRHLHDCKDCRAYRGELKAVHARFAALVPALGPGAVLAKLLGIGGGGAAAGGGASAASAGASAGATIGGGALGVTASHVAAAVAVAVATAGGAVEVQQTLTPAHPHRHVAIHRVVPAASLPVRPTVLLPHSISALPAASPATKAKRLRIATPTLDAVAAPALPATDSTAVPPVGNGGAAAPVDPALDPAPATPVPDESGTPTGTQIGSTGTPTPPPSTSPATQPGDSAVPVAPPAATATTAPAAPTTPPTSASTGGASLPRR